MKIPKDLIELSQKAEIYVVGGYVRNFFMGAARSTDIDLAGPLSLEELKNVISTAAEKSQHTKKIELISVNPKLGTFLIILPSGKYEYTPFRTESYTGGNHTPDAVTFGAGIYEDSCRRDFSANSIYYNIRKGEFVDFHSGINDIKNKILRAAPEPDTVFAADGLRLMRLARQAAETGFRIDDRTFAAAKSQTQLLEDISAERIQGELIRILTADMTYGIADAHYRGIKILKELCLWRYIIPELQDAVGCNQNSRHHAYDVFEHTAQTVKNCPANIILRLAALLHDIAKPYCIKNFGKMHGHAEYGAKMTRKILNRLKFSNDITDRVTRLVEHHMYDSDGKTRLNKVRLFVAENSDIIEDLVALKYADFLSKGVGGGFFEDRLLDAYHKMIQEGTPMTVRELALKGDRLAELGVEPKDRGKVMKELLRAVICGEVENMEEKLIQAIKKGRPPTEGN